MDLTINCTRVPIPRGTTLYGIPVEVGPAPAYLGLDSDPVSSNETYDEVASNPNGQATPDGDDDRPKTSTNYLIKCSNKTIISTLNARTLRPKGRFEELAECTRSHSIDILAVQEHRFHHPDDTIQYQSIGSYQLITSSATKNSSNSSVGGVGFLISSKASNNLLSVESITPRIMILELQGNPKTTIICAYSPHNDAPECDVEDFYSNLRATMEQIPQHNFFVLCGDLNAKLGTPDVNFSFNETTNRNGEMLIDFMEEFNLFSSNNHFMKSKNQLWTFEYPSGKRAQLDYILFRKKWRNSIQNSRSYSSFSTVGSDHRIVSSYVKLSLRASKKSQPHPMKTIDWKEVSTNKDLCNNYSVTVLNRFQSLTQNNEIELENLEQSYNHLVKATQEVALEMLPKKQKGKKYLPVKDTSVIQAREKLKSLSLEYHRNPTTNKNISLIMAKKNLDDAYLSAEANYINGKITDISHLHINNKHHAAWKTIKEISGKSSKPTIRIKGGSTEKRMLSWSNHFENLLGKGPKLPDNITLPSVKISNTLNIETSEFTLNELSAVIKQLKPSKAFGPDNIPAIIWKESLFHELLLKLCNFCFLNKSCPSIWRKSQIIPVPKKGDLSLATNYRGISLLPIAAKIYNKLILNRLLPYVEPLLRNNQNGFRAGRTTISQILSLRRIIEEANFCNLDAAYVFVDFSKAFDSVDRTKLLEILELYGIPIEIIEAIKILYTDTSATILTPDGETPPFSINAGILQGDTLAPFLFILVVDYVMRMSVDNINENGFQIHPRKSSRHPAVFITDLDFADDIALISNSLENAQALLQSLESAANCVGLHLNETKTKYINNCKTNNINYEIKTLNNTVLGKVDDYKYLGSFISNSEKDFNTRKGMAWSACNDLHKIWVSNLTDKFKIQIFRAIVEPILLYGSETWTLSAKLEKRLDGTYTRLLMRAKNLSWKHHPRKDQIYGDLPQVSSLVKARRTQFAGHCFRASNEVVSSLILWKPQSIGRKSHKLTFPDVISRDTGISKQDLGTAMQDRDFWSGVVKSVTSTAVEK